MEFSKEVLKRSFSKEVSQMKFSNEVLKWSSQMKLKNDMQNSSTLFWGRYVNIRIFHNTKQKSFTKPKKLSLECALFLGPTYLINYSIRWYKIIFYSIFFIISESLMSFLNTIGKNIHFFQFAAKILFQKNFTCLSNTNIPNYYQTNFSSKYHYWWNWMAS